MRPPSLRVEVRVGEQVRDDLAHARRVGERGGQRRGDVDLELLVGARRSAGAISAATSRTTSATAIGRRWISSWPASTRATSSRSLTRSTSRLVRQQDDVDELALALGRARSAPSSSTKPLIDVSGRAQLVRGGRDELALGALEAGALGRVAHGQDDAVGAAAAPIRAAVTASVRPSCVDLDLRAERLARAAAAARGRRRRCGPARARARAPRRAG